MPPILFILILKIESYFLLRLAWTLILLVFASHCHWGDIFFCW
jgi:hypothetical protein